MTDDRFTSLVSRLLDDDLSDEERREVDTRIAEDPGARREADEFRMTVALLRGLDELEAPASILAGVRESIHRPPWHKRFADWLVGGPFLTPARGLAFTLVAVVTAGVIYTIQSAPSQLGAIAPVGELAMLKPEADPPSTSARDRRAPALAELTQPEEEAVAPASTGLGREENAVSLGTIAARGPSGDADALAGLGDGQRNTMPIDPPPPPVVMKSAPSEPETGVVEVAMRSDAEPVSGAVPMVEGAVQPRSPELPLEADFVLYGPGSGGGIELSSLHAGRDIDRLETVSEVGGEPLVSERYRVDAGEDRNTRVYAHRSAEAEAKPKTRREFFAPCESKHAKPAPPKDEVATGESGPLCKRIIRVPIQMANVDKETLESKTDEPRTVKFDRDNLVQEFKGTYSGLKERGEYVIEDEAEWKRLWAKMTSNMVPPPETPAIDFEMNIAIGASMGEQNSGGYATMIEAIELEGGTMRVIVRQVRPGDPDSTGGMTMALTQPYHILILPRQMAGDYFSSAKGHQVTFEYR